MASKSSKDVSSLLGNTAKSSNFGLLFSDEEDEEVAVPVELKATEEATAPIPISNGTVEDSSEWTTSFARNHHSGVGKGPQKPRSHQGSWNGSATSPSSHQTQHQPQQSQNRNHSNHTHGQKPRQPQLTIDQLSAENTLVVSGFPPTWRTADLRKLFEAYEGQFRFKWQDDTSCFIRFDDNALADKAFEAVKPEHATIQRFSPATVHEPTPADQRIQLTPENTLEVYAFPPQWTGQDVERLLGHLPSAAKYRLKWRSENSCWVVFESAEECKEATVELSKETHVKIRPYHDHHQHAPAQH